MPARAALKDLVMEAVPTLGDAWPTNAPDTPAVDFFAVIRWETDDLPSFPGKTTERVEIWLYDKAADYGQIDDALDALKNSISAATHRAGGDGWTLTAATWTGNSADLVDDVYHAVTRYATFTVASRRTG